MVFNNNLLLGAAGAAGGGYTIAQSVRFNDNDSAYLSRTPSSAGNKRTWTWSCWIKRANLGTEQELLFCGPTGSDLFESQFFNDALFIQDYNGSIQLRLQTNRVFRDTSTWYHLMFVFDTTQATSSDRFKLYVNGQRETSFSYEAYPALNYEGRVNATIEHSIAYKWQNTSLYLDGYLAEINFIDGTALDPSSLGKTNSTTGQWVPVKYNGSYGTNGYYITGEDSADFGADYSGNGNDFTSSGLTSDDQVTDTPTDNWSTWNPLNYTAGGLTFSDGNLQVAETTATQSRHAKSTVGFSYGEKKVAEMQLVSGSGVEFGICDEALEVNNNSHTGDSRGYYSNGNKADAAGTQTPYGSTFTIGDVIRVEVDLSSNPGSIEFFKNGTSQGVAFSDIDSTKTWFFFCRVTGDAIKANFGQLGFSGTPTTGFTAARTADLPDPTIALPTDYFQTVLDTGANIKTTAEALYTDQFEWIKDRANTNNHQLIDSVRGTSAVIWSNGSTAETTYSTPSGNSVGWVWNQNGTGSSNTDGTITSTVAANTTSGFSTVTYTGSGVANDTVGHGLGVAPAMIMCFCLDSTANGIRVFHEDLTAGQSLYLNSTLAAGAEGDRIASPTSTTFTVTGTAANKVNGSGDDYLAYCFAEVENFSKFGSYIGNATANNGTFVYLGFRPAFLLIKRITAASNWYMYDSVRGAYNENNNFMWANATNSDPGDGVDRGIDFLSNGFKLRTGSSYDPNDSGTWVYAAFAEFPFKTANAR